MDSERRQHERLPIKFALSCRRVTLRTSYEHRGFTSNVSTGGVCFEMVAQTFKPGDFVKIDFLVPPTIGVLESGGKITAFVKVLRTQSLIDSSSQKDEVSGRFAVAAQFCQLPRLSM
jgi:hypothetical protein